ncbi:hypothetical protein BH18ACT12_BH18ACT12_11590 [soil metagenome]
MPLLALAVGLAGCGSSPREVTKAQYKKELERIGKVASDAGSELGRAIDIATFNGNVDKFQDTLRDAGGDLDGLKPPQNVRDVNERLADSFRDFADELEPVKEARRKSIFKARDALGKVARSDGVKNARAAIRELKRKGYDVQVLGEL